jgi:3-methylcrotonyl-CoA carboxylase beta subunit
MTALRFWIVAACRSRALWRRRPVGERHHQRGRECVIVANDAIIKGGTYYPMTVKHLLSHDGEEASARAGHRAVEQSALHLHGGFRRRVSADAGRDLSGKRHFGRIFYNQAQMSALGIPQIAIVMGSCTAGRAELAEIETAA